MSIHFSFHRGTLGQQSWHDVQALYATEDMGVRITVSTGGRHRPIAIMQCDARRALYDGITCCTALDGNCCRPWTARSTSDEVRHITVTNCCRTCTFDNTSAASCCNCRAADRAFSTPCDEPSTPGCGSSVVPTPEHRRTPETAGQSVVPHAPGKSSVHLTPPVK